MQPIRLSILSCLLLVSANGYTQVIKFGAYTLRPVQVAISVERFNGEDAVKVIKDSTVKAVDQPTFARLTGTHFHSGTIEVKVLSRLLKTAPEGARGFIGIAFRIDDINSKFESIYLRPTNGRADSQLRRNRSIQYFSFPDYPFERLRKEAPGEYEAYTDMGLNEWITMRIEVNGNGAKLYLNNGTQPSLLVNALKHGPDASGAIGLWVDVGTEGYFKDLRISEK